MLRKPCGILYLKIFMNNLEFTAFVKLFKEAYQKCFNYPLQKSLSETDSKFLSNEILEQTGLIIGWKSLKNYSFFVLGGYNDKQENPSIATLDTLVRYIQNAPFIAEAQRKIDEGHYPYWFRYKDQFQLSYAKSSQPGRKSFKNVAYIGIALLLLLALGWSLSDLGEIKSITDDFSIVREDSLIAKGWIIQAKENLYWNQRGERKDHLTLFTLKGDNWTDSSEIPAIKNLLVRKIPSDCFTVETQISDFIPTENWQQAGILLMEDTRFASKSIRLSLAYNDFSGGYPISKQVLIQAITSNGNIMDKPEEISHHLIYSINKKEELSLIKENLKHAAFRIEKKGKKIRFLFANGSMQNPAFKEIATHEFDINPRYVGIFAIKGFVNESRIIPAHFDFFSLKTNECN